MLIIWFQNGWDEQYVQSWRTRLTEFFINRTPRKPCVKQPQLQGKLLAKGPGIINWWMNWCRSPAILVLPKPRYSGFFNTPLDSILRSRGIRHLVFTGIAYQRLRRIDATRWLFLEYFGVVLEDAPQRRAGICTESRVVQYRNLFWLGQRRPKRSATRFLPHPLLVSPRV